MKQGARQQGAFATSIAPGHAREAWLSSTRALAEAELSAWRARGMHAPLHVSLDAPNVTVETMLKSAVIEPSVMWAPADGSAFLGIGEALVCEHDHTTSLQSTRDQVRRTLDGLEVVDHAATSITPRMFGGLAFRADQPASPEWAAFGAGAFVLPRLTYGVHPSHAWLSLCFVPEDAAERTQRPDGDQTLDLLDALAHALFDAADERPHTPRADVQHAPRDGFVSAVDAVRGAIARGEVEKVVLARRSVVTSAPRSSTGIAGAPTVQGALAHLSGRFPRCTRFAMVRGGAAFIGATPECLVAQKGDRVHTEALAGSMPVGEAKRLRESEKDRKEHRFVVDAIVSALEPYCASVTHDPTPGVRELPNVVHLRTPIEGRLRDASHVLDLVVALHPTPAVGGVPRHVALDQIAAHEPHSRGWYSAPFGWVDAKGDGRFAVALRSGLIDTHHDQAFVYAGAGIVRDSIADAEYDETVLKMRPLLGALGAQG